VSDQLSDYAPEPAVSEEPIHDRCAGLDDGPDLMPVHQFGDSDAAVADELRDGPEGHAGIGEQRNEGVP
jgi:hypothetical protein